MTGLFEEAQEQADQVAKCDFYQGGEHGAHLDRCIAEAQPTATLALVEQQRIANLITWLKFGDKNGWVTRGMTGDQADALAMRLVTEIRERLGL